MKKCLISVIVTIVITNILEIDGSKHAFHGLNKYFQEHRISGPDVSKLHAVFDYEPMPLRTSYQVHNINRGQDQYKHIVDLRPNQSDYFTKISDLEVNPWIEE